MSAFFFTTVPPERWPPTEATWRAVTETPDFDRTGDDAPDDGEEPTEPEQPPADDSVEE